MRIAPFVFHFVEFDPQWNENGLLDKAMSLLSTWVEAQNVPGLRMKVYKEENRTPLMFVEVDATKSDAATVLLYGAYDDFNTEM